MRKIACECCEPRTDGRIISGASWIIYGSVYICETCRLVAIEWMMNMGFTFAHPFICEITTVESNIKPKNST